MSPHGRVVIVAASALVLSACSAFHHIPVYSSLAELEGRPSTDETSSTSPAQVRPRATHVVFREEKQDKDQNKLKKYSAEWWEAKESRDRADDLKLAKSMMICRGCLPVEKPNSDQRTSVAQNKRLPMLGDARLESRGQVLGPIVSR